MRIVRLSAVSVSLALSLWSTTALAQADEAGAAKLLGVFQTYLGSAEGAVAVAVDGDAYAVTIDPAVLMSAVPADGMTTTITPLEMTVTDNADGTWSYEVDQPVTVTYDVAGLMTSTTSYGQVLLSGTFDEALGDSSAYSLAINDVVSDQTQTDPTLGEMVVKMVQDSMTMEGTAVAGANGLDSQFTTAASGLTYDINIPGADGAPPTVISASVAEATADGTMTGYQPEALYGLLAFFVAHPSEALIESNRPGLKTALEAALPVFENLNMTGAYTGVAVNTPLGPVTMNEVGLTIDMNGVVADGKFREAISIKGLSLADGMVPPFAAGLVPSDLTLDVAASKFDLAAAAGLGLGLLDLPADAPPPEGFDMQLMSAIMPAGTVDITIAPGETTAAAYRLTYEGAMTVGPAMPMPVGKARIGLTGLDAINEALMASPPEMGLQEMGMMTGMAQMMAQPGVDGELIWEIESTATGGLLINGQDMMGGGQ